MKAPDDCTGLPDVREGIDHIDREIVRLLGRRLKYVLAAAQFKPNEASIAAPDRVKTMLGDRRRWASEEGLSEDFVDALFKDVTDWYIATQTAHWRTAHAS